MYVAEKIREPAQVTAVALKAYARVAEAWGPNFKEAAGPSARGSAPRSRVSRGN